MANNELNQAIAEAVGLWTQGNQPGAIDRLRPDADRGEPRALALVTWFLYQMPEPRWREGIPYAEAAISKGMPWVINYFVGNMSNDPTLRTKLPQLMKSATEAGWSIDPMGYVVPSFQQGDPGTAFALLDAAIGPWPHPQAWNEFVQRAQGEFARLTSATGDVEALRTEAAAAIAAHQSAIQEQRASVETRTSHLLGLIDRTTSAQAQAFFDEEATKNQRESSFLWKWGVAIISLAAAFAIAPIVIYYIGRMLDRNWLAGENLIAAHFAPAIALGAVAGILLARSRGRDRAGQRARNLAVALETMFVYSAQIVNEEERQRFLHDMGRTVIEAYLRQDAPSAQGDGRSLLEALRRT